MTENKLDPRELTAIQAAERIARELSSDSAMVEAILRMYRTGLNQPAIAEELIPHEMLLSARVARNAIGLILKSHLDSTERTELAERYKREASVDVGYDTLERGVGIHAQTSEERSIRASQNYHISLGTVTAERRAKIARAEDAKRRQNGTGIYGFTDAERSEYSRRGVEALSEEQRLAIAHNMLRKTGKIPISDDERRRILELGKDPDYKVAFGSNKGKPDRIKIQRAILEEFGIKRSRASISRLFRKARLKEKEEQDS